MAQFGQALRRERNRLHVSQDALATRAGMDRGHLSKIENGTIRLPSPAVVARLAAALDTTPDALYARAGIRPPDQFDDDPDDALAGRIAAVVDRWSPQQRALLWQYIEAVSAALDAGDPPVDDDAAPPIAATG